MTYRQWLIVALVIGAMATLALATWSVKPRLVAAGEGCDEQAEPVRPLPKSGRR